MVTINDVLSLISVVSLLHIFIIVYLYRRLMNYLDELNSKINSINGSNDIIYAVCRDCRSEINEIKKSILSTKIEFVGIKGVLSNVDERLDDIHDRLIDDRKSTCDNCIHGEVCETITRISNAPDNEMKDKCQHFEMKPKEK